MLARPSRPLVYMLLSFPIVGGFKDHASNEIVISYPLLSNDFILAYGVFFEPCIGNGIHNEGGIA